MAPLSEIEISGGVVRDVEVAVSKAVEAPEQAVEDADVTALCALQSRDAAAVAGDLSGCRRRRLRIGLVGGALLSCCLAGALLVARDGEGSFEDVEPTATASLHPMWAAQGRRLTPQNVQNVGVNCQLAAPGSQCFVAVEWTRSVGIKQHPDWYPEWLREDSSFEDFQAALHSDAYALCPHPCHSTRYVSLFANMTLQPAVGFASSGRVVSQGLWCRAPEPAAGWSPARCNSDADAQRLDVKVLTYNLFWWNLFGLRGGSGGVAGHLIQAANLADAKFDFMGFQECEGIAQVMQDGGLCDEYGALVGPHAMCMTYRKSAWDLIDDGAQDVAEDRADQWYGHRAVMWARLRHKATQRVAFFVNHHGPLPVHTGGRCGGEAVAYNVLRVIAAEAKAGDGVVLVGDFNSGPTSLTLQSFTGRLDHAYHGSAFGGVDNILTGCTSLISARNLGSGGSDHDALEVLLRM